MVGVRFEDAVIFEIEAKRERNFDNKSDFYYEAAKIYEQIGNEEYYKLNLAKHYYINGIIFSRSSEFDKALDDFKISEELFLDLNKIRDAFYSASNFFFTITKKEKNGEVLDEKEISHRLEIFFDKYNIFSNHQKYLKIKAYEFERKAKKGKVERNFNGAANFYLSAADIFKKLGYEKEWKWNVANNFLLKGNIYTHSKQYRKARQFFRNGEKIFMELGIKEIAFYCGRNYMHTLFFERMIEENRIKNLEGIKKDYYQSENIHLSKYSELLWLYCKAKNVIKKCNFKKGIGFLNKAIKIAEKLEIPNLIFSRDFLISERLLFESHSYLSKYEYLKASNFLEQWLDFNKSIEYTKRYKFNSILNECYKILNKKVITNEEKYKSEELLSLVRDNKLPFLLNDICSLLHSYVLMSKQKCDETTLGEIKIEIIGRVTKSYRIIEILKQKIEIQNAIEEKTWLNRLPSLYSEKFDKCLYLLKDISDEFKHTAFYEFYTLLENYIKLIVEFNAKIIWKNDWNIKLHEELSRKEPFDSFSYGTLLEALKSLKYNKSVYCKDISEETINLVDKHVKIRNTIHNLEKNVSEIDIEKDVSIIFYSLLNCFPTCIKILSDRKRPWYDVMLYLQSPKRISLYFINKLEVGGYYFIEPIVSVPENLKIKPKKIMTIHSLEALGFKKDIEQEDIIYIKPVKEFMTEITSIILESKENVAYIEKLLKQEFPLIETNFKRCRRVFFEIFRYSFVYIKTKKDWFSNPSIVFNILLDLGNKFHGNNFRISVIKSFTESCPRMFKNIIFGKIERVKMFEENIKINSKDDLKLLLESFNTNFGELGLKAPSFNDIEKICNEEIKKKSEGEMQKFNEIMKIFDRQTS